MTDEQMRIAIAEACGLEITADGKWASCSHEFVKSWKTSVGDEPDRFYGPLPDYLHDLNAMREAVEKLTTEGFIAWCSYLRKTVGTNESMNATARQRVEAFLRTVGKWRDE